jgi:exosortase A-associated hydrolase 1
MTTTSQPVTFACGQDWLLGIVTRPEKPRSRGVLIAVGGPQYRAGSHRQFVLLANELAAQGYAVMRFDYRGMGDSTGEPRTFENVEEDLRRAVDHFLARVPEVTEVVIWGLCDAASAALFYSHQDPRVTGMVLLNPWVRTAQGEARTYLKHYYLRHAFSAAPWAKLFSGQFDLAASAASFVRNLRRAGAAGKQVLPERMAQGLASFEGQVLLILSGNDLTAKEFSDLAASSKRWRRLLSSQRVAQHRLADASHTFPRRDWRDQVARWTSAWLKLDARRSPR